jgi:hypothetical protein
MISTTSAPPAAIILDISKDNWSQWNLSFKLLCYTTFGVAGQQVLSDRLIPLHPFATDPSKADLELDDTGTPIPGEFVYSRRPLTPQEIVLPPIDPSFQPLSTLGNTNLRDDRKIYAASLRRFSDQDTSCLDHLYKHISFTSHTAVKTHHAYPTYQLLPIGTRSYAFYCMVRDIHSIGNVATKLHRTRLYVNVSQSDLPHETYMDLVTSTAS